MQQTLFINIVYEHLRPDQVCSAYQAGVFVMWSPSPLADFDIYAYLNASSFRGKQPAVDVLLMLEPVVVLPGEYNEEVWQHFDQIFTLFDALAGRERKFTKILYPRSDWVVDAPSTQDREQRRKLYPLENRRNAICMINGNKQSRVPTELYSKRIKTTQWFHHRSDLPCDIFGNPPFDLPNYKGVLAPDAKLSTLSQYRFCLCFENTNHPTLSAGYITEKILDCFEARTIPIYFGSVNIEKYIPQECFIDLRRFTSLRLLNEYLHSLGTAEYTQFIDNMDAWVAAGGLRPYSWYSIYDQLAGLVCSIAPDPGAWSSGIPPSLSDRTWIPARASAPLWSWSALANGTSSLLAETDHDS